MKHASLILLASVLVLACGRGYEGEMNLGGMTTDAEGALVPNVWAFTVPDDQLALVEKVSEIQRSGKRATMQYAQWVIGPICADSGYEVTGVR